MPVQDRSVAFIGLGNLGSPMARRLIDRGWEVKVADRDADRTATLVDSGASPFADAACVRFICFATPDESGIDQTLDDGLLDGLTPAQVVVVHSTILPEGARALARRIEATGAGFIEAPVSGGAERARSGELTVFAGGEHDTIESARVLLGDLGSEIFEMGDVGAASSTKLANQLVLFAATAGIHEALRLTSRYGVDDWDVLQALETGLGDSWAGRHWGFFDALAADYDKAGVPVTERPWSKDLREVVEAARVAGAPAPIAAALAEIVPDLIERHSHAVRDRKVQA